jgi:hypothetical protein
MRDRAFVFLALVVATATCAQERNVGDPGDPDDAASSASGTGGATGSGGGASSGGSLGIGGDLHSGGTGGGSDDCDVVCCLTCSTDLTKVVDCNGDLVAECPADQACAAGECIADTCLAAEASKSSYGCDYWPLETDVVGIASGACFAAFVANTWSVPVHLSVELGGEVLPIETFARIPKGQGQATTYEPYDPIGGLPVGEVAILFLSGAEGSLVDCPVTPAVAYDASVHGTGRGQAFHLTTDRPVVAYQILPYGGGDGLAASATLLLPSSAWGTNYIAVNAYGDSGIPTLYPSLDILAREDDTEVTVLPTAAIEGNVDVLPSDANTPVTYTLAKGEYLQLTQAAELTGSTIQSSKPVAVFGGSTCMNIPVDSYACDAAQQQLAPVKALGSEYVALRYRGRSANPDESVPWRLVGAVDGTQLTYLPAAPPGAPETLERGQVVEFADPGPFVVRSQDTMHPFYAGAYMTSATFLGPDEVEGDPEWVNIVPPKQYLDSYVFFTDPTYSETSLNIVRRPDENGVFADVTLDCAGVLGNWQPLGDYEWTRVDLVTGDFESVGGCANGRHEISSAQPFGVTVWGWGSAASLSLNTTFVSYAYPAGAGFQPINATVVPPVPR